MHNVYFAPYTLSHIRPVHMKYAPFTLQLARIYTLYFSINKHLCIAWTLPSHVGIYLRWKRLNRNIGRFVWFKERGEVNERISFVLSLRQMLGTSVERYWNFVRLLSPFLRRSSINVKNAGGCGGINVWFLFALRFFFVLISLLPQPRESIRFSPRRIFNFLYRIFHLIFHRANTRQGERERVVVEIFRKLSRSIVTFGQRQV